jgi:hypothetical protein
MNCSSKKQGINKKALSYSSHGRGTSRTIEVAFIYKGGILNNKFFDNLHNEFLNKYYKNLKNKIIDIFF